MSDVFERRPSALKPESDGFARLPSAGKQVQWADDADLAAESPSKGKDGFWSPKARGHTAASSATQKSRAETAIDVLFGDQASPRTERAQLHERVPTAAARRRHTGRPLWWAARGQQDGFSGSQLGILEIRGRRCEELCKF